MREEIKYILDALEVKSPSAASYRTRLINVLDDLPALENFANELKREVQSTKDISDDRLPFYEFYLAIACQENDLEAARQKLSNAVHNFRIRDFAIDEALGEWLFSILHFENQKYERAQRACETAITILQQLITRCKDESKYEKVTELKQHLSQLREFQDSIKTPPALDDLKTDDNSSLNKTPYVSVKSKLQDFHDELKKIYTDLKDQNKRIPPTLVAAIFYIYKTLTPSHSVYSKVPPPETDREKEIYKNLINKIGFFEVIEQLVALQQETAPIASREEILEKINQEWDRDLNR